MGAGKSAALQPTKLNLTPNALQALTSTCGETCIQGAVIRDSKKVQQVSDDEIVNHRGLIFSCFTTCVTLILRRRSN